LREKRLGPGGVTKKDQHEAEASLLLRAANVVAPQECVVKDRIPRPATAA
jgi:hypothetical protein